MEKNFYWIRISVFYFDEEWHNLIKYGINPLIKHYKITNNNLEYKLYLNRNRGSNIRLSLRVQKKDFINWSKYGHVSLNNFVEVNPSYNSPNVFSESLFMDFPNNTVHYNLYDILPSDQKRKRNIELLERSLSKAISEVFAMEPVTNDVLISFIVYLQLSIFQAQYPIVIDAINSVDELINFLIEIPDIDENNLPLPQMTAEKVFEENINILNDIVYEIWVTNYEKKSTWLHNWSTTCKKILKKEKLFNHIFFEISNLIYQHLGLDPISQKHNSIYLFRSALLNGNTKQRIITKQ